MQLKFIIYHRSETWKLLRKEIWTDNVEIRRDGVIIFYEYLDENTRMVKAAFKNWEYFTIDDYDNDREEKETRST